jgi:protein-L-isoaspartate(D-aspartate) O-methyltransferase
MAPQRQHNGEPDARPASEASVQAFIDNYVRGLEKAGAIRSRAVERAFRAVPRHRLLETFYYRPNGLNAAPIPHDPERPSSEQLTLIYSDTALATRVTHGMPTSSTSEPSLVAEMLELLDLAEGMKVLEIGAGTGYNAALMAEIVGDQRLVTTMDVLEDVVDQTRRLLGVAGYPGIRVLAGDGFEGHPEQAPYDRIVVTVGCSDLSPRWAGQLSEHGILLVPLEQAGGHPLTVIRKESGTLHGHVAKWTMFIPVRGPLQIAGMWAPGVVRPESPGEVHVRAPWPGFGAAGPVASLGGSSTDEIDFLFFLGLHDHRACQAPQGVALSDGPAGWAVAGPDGIRWWKDESLASKLDVVYEEWIACGRPGIHDYRVTFRPTGEDAELAATGWDIERRFYREHFAKST